MDNRRPDHEVLPAKVAERVLARASELEAARNAGMGVAQLREAAAEAGISTESFDAALGELRAAEAGVPEPVARERRRTRVWAFAAGMGAMILLLGTLIIPRAVATPRVVATTVEQTFELKCLPSDKAIELLAPELGTNGTVAASKDAPRVLKVSGTPAQLERVRDVLDKNDNSAACARR